MNYPTGSLLLDILLQIGAVTAFTIVGLCVMIVGVQVAVKIMHSDRRK